MGEQNLLSTTSLKQKKNKKLFPHTHAYPFTYIPYINLLLLLFSCYFTMEAINSVEAIASNFKLSPFTEYSCSPNPQSHCYLQIRSSAYNLKPYSCKHTEKTAQQAILEPPCAAYP